MKHCPKCGTNKDKSEFHRASNRSDGLQGHCKSCQRIDPDKMRDYRIRSTYGIGADEYDDYLSKPCSICGHPSQHLDLDHATGRVRGGLCAHCNVGIGNLFDSPDLLRRAALYLENHGRRN